MVTYDFSEITAAPKASISSDNLIASQMVGLEAFLGKPIDEVLVKSHQKNLEF